MTADSASLRLALVDDLCRRGLIRTPAVREAFARVPRERFIPRVAEERGLAAVYEDTALVTLTSPQGLAISSSSQPAIMAEMLERLSVGSGVRVLEIGAGTGYNAALLAELGARVVSVDVDADLASAAAQRLVDWPGVEVAAGDGMRGWTAGAPYDRIIVTATPPCIPAAWRDQLREGGLLEVPMLLGHDQAVVQVVVTFRRVGAELVSAGMVSGGFMAFRGPEGQPPDYPRPVMGWHDAAAKWGGGVYGAGPARLPAAARRRLLGRLLTGGVRGRAGRGASLGLPMAVVCWAPPGRLAAVVAGRDHALGLVDDRGNLSAITARWHRSRPFRVIGTERYGDAGDADRELHGLIGAWRSAGGPDLEGFEIRVAFGRQPAGARWRLPSAGEARVGVSLRPARPAPPTDRPAPRP